MEWTKKAVSNSDETILEQFRQESMPGIRVSSPYVHVFRTIRETSEKLNSIVRGQKNAVDKVMKLLAAWMLTPLRDKKVPLKMALCGPPSCGKGLLASTLAGTLRLDDGSPMPFMELDMAGYCSHQNWESLMGFNSSYTDGKAGTLTGFVKENPTCVLVFKHIDSAHENTIHALKNILLDGVGKDRHEDRQVDFSKSIIFLTSNCELGPESRMDVSVTADLRKNLIYFGEIQPADLFVICRDVVHQCARTTEKRLATLLTGITPSVEWYLAANQMPDANARNIADSVNGVLWGKAMEAYLLGVESGNEELSQITIKAPMLAELEGAADPVLVAANSLRRLIGARRRVVFDIYSEVRDGIVVIELRDIREEMVSPPTDRGLILEGIPEKGLESVLGHKEAIGRLRTVAALVKRDGNCPAPPRGLLFHGAPGTGKTASACAFAAEANIPIVRVSAGDLLSAVSGGTAKSVRQAFTVCQRYAAPSSILFIDELDSLCREREAVTELLTCMQGAHSFPNVLVIGTTNRPEDLDEALARRFDVKIAFELPTSLEREEILAHYLKGLPVADDIRLWQIAKMAVGLSGAFLEDLVQDARRIAFERGDVLITEECLHTALENIRFGESSSISICSEIERRVIACHEAGHAVAMLHLQPEGVQELGGISILNRKGLMGVLLRDASSRIEHLDKLVNHIGVLYAGIEAERILLGVETTGCHRDLQHAANTAEYLVLNMGYGMDNAVTGNGNGYRGYVDETLRRKAAEQVTALLGRQRARASDLVREHRVIVGRVANALIEKERLTAGEVLSIINEKKSA